MDPLAHASLKIEQFEKKEGTGGGSDVDEEHPVFKAIGCFNENDFLEFRVGASKDLKMKLQGIDMLLQLYETELGVEKVRRFRAEVKVTLRSGSQPKSFVTNGNRNIGETLLSRQASYSNSTVDPQIKLGLITAQNGQAIVGAKNSMPDIVEVLTKMEPPTNLSIQQKNALPQLEGNDKPGNPSRMSITLVPKPGASTSVVSAFPLAQAQSVSEAQKIGKTSLINCEICDSSLKDLEELRRHLYLNHKVKMPHTKMIYQKPPLNCQKCVLRFFTDHGLERHMLGAHGLVSTSMKVDAEEGHDSGHCPVCGKVCRSKLLSHVANDHSVTLKPTHLTYKCKVCSDTFGRYKLFESHLYSTHVFPKNAKRGSSILKNNNSMDESAKPVISSRSLAMPSRMQARSPPMSTGKSQDQLKPLKLTDEITLIPIIPKPLMSELASGVDLDLRKGSLTISMQNKL